MPFPFTVSARCTCCCALKYFARDAAAARGEVGKKTERQMGNERSNSRNEKKSVGVVEVSACIGRGGGRRVCRSQRRGEESEGEEKVGGET